MIVVGILLCVVLTIASFMALIKSHDPEFPGLVREAVARNGKVSSGKEIHDGIVIARGIILALGCASALCAIILIAK